MDEKSAEKDNRQATKLMFGVLCFLGILTLILGVMQIVNALNPYIETEAGKANQTQIDFSQGLDNIGQSVEKLKSLDSDADGLTDYDELYVYSTSPYLSDSDSDGYADKAEIDGGFDPNCPKGQDCRGSSADNNQPATGSDASGGNGDQSEQGGFTQEYGASDATSSSPAIMEQITPEQIREFILESGQMTAEQLSQIDDETLIQIWNQAVEETK